MIKVKEPYPDKGNMRTHRYALAKQERHHRTQLEVLLVKVLASKNSAIAKMENGLYYAVCVPGSVVDKALNKLPNGAK